MILNFLIELELINEQNKIPWLMFVKEYCDWIIKNWVIVKLYLDKFKFESYRKRYVRRLVNTKSNAIYQLLNMIKKVLWY